MKEPDLLIRTKLRLPFVRPSLVPRARLQARIVEGLQGPLTLVIAPAGFGKTTLLAASLADRGMPPAWLSLDRDDNQAGRFLTYLVAALHEVDHSIGSEAAQLLAGIQPAPPQAVLTSLINDLEAAGGAVALVLDDYQSISSQAVHAEVTFILEHCPNNFHLLIASRSDPPLPISRMRARGQMVELRAADLRFTAGEAAQFLNDVMGLHLDAGSVAVLEDRTEGWVAGLQMAALSMRDREDVRGFIDGFSGTNRHILDYLLEETLARQTPEIQRFLLRTAILERLTAPLCDALLVDPEDPASGAEAGLQPGLLPCRPSASALEYLDRENLFLVSLDSERVWFRYHHLFADLLRARLSQEQPDLIPRLHRRASAWLEENGLIPEAIRHLLAAHETEHAADLIERYAPARWIESDFTIVQMAEDLPRELLLERPKIGLYLAWLLINRGAIEKAYPLLKELEQSRTGAAPDAGQGWISTLVRLALTFLIPPPGMPGLDPLPDERALDEVPADELILRDTANILYGMALMRRGEIDRAADFAVKCVQKEKARRGNLVVPTLIPMLASLNLFQGRLHAAAALCRDFLASIYAQGLRIDAAGSMEVILGDVLYEWNCLDEAEKHIRGALQANVPWGNIMTDALGLLALALVLQAKGDYAGSLQIVEQFERRLQGETRPVEFQGPFHTLRTRVQLASGDLQKASQWAEQVEHSEDFHLHPDFYWLLLARIHLAEGRFTEVEKMVGENVLVSGAGNRIVRQLELDLLKASALAGERRLPAALEIIDSCLALAEPEGYIQVFLEGGEAVRELLAAYLRLAAPGHPLYAQKLLDAFSPAARGSSPLSQPAEMIEPLSSREREVLELIAMGKTNVEIAGQLVLSPGTVKAHTASIYRKLDVANRTEAVARARQLGILS